jgi:hypothetical protein
MTMLFEVRGGNVDEWLITDLEGGGHNTFAGTEPAFTWEYWAKPRNRWSHSPTKAQTEHI